MSEYRPLEEWLALFAALEAELLAAPPDELRQAAPRATLLPDAADRVIAAALDGTEPIPGMMPLNGFIHGSVAKGH